MMAVALEDQLPEALRSGLTEGERRLLAATEAGDVADLSQLADNEREVRAELLCRLCTDEGALRRVHARGIAVRGAAVKGKLDLTGAVISRRLRILASAIPDGVVLDEARTQSIELRASKLGFLSGRNMEAAGSVILHEVECSSGMSLTEAVIHGRLDLRKASLRGGPGRKALDATYVRVSGSVLLGEGFHAKGEVRLPGAVIGGQLACSGGRFENRQGPALGADAIQVKGDVLFGAGFHAVGAVRLLGAEIGGQLVCSGGRFENPRGDAFAADHLHVKQDAFFGTGFHATGEVLLLGAEIGGQLVCSGGRFENPQGDAFAADTMHVRGGALFGAGFHATGEVRLLGAEIGGQLVCSGGRFENPEGIALHADGVHVEQSAFFHQGFHATGAVRLPGAEIGGQLACSGGRFENPQGDAFAADTMHVRGSVFFGDGFHATGAVRLLGAEIGGQLVCSGGRFENPEGIALHADGIHVEQSVFFHQAFHATGAVRLPGAEIGGQLACSDGQFEALDLRYGKAEVLEDSPGSWPAKILLDGFEYVSLGPRALQAMSQMGPRKAVSQRLNWLRRQPGWRPQPYDQLAKVLHGIGHEEEARDILIAKFDDMIGRAPLSRWTKIWRRILGVTTGHGYRPGKVLYWIVPLLLLATLLSWWAGAQGLMAPTAPAIVANPSYLQTGRVPADYPGFNPVAYAADTFFPLVDLGQESHWAPKAWRKEGAWLRAYLWLVHIPAGWFLSTLGVAGVTGLVRRLV